MQFQNLLSNSYEEQPQQIIKIVDSNICCGQTMQEQNKCNYMCLICGMYKNIPFDTVIKQEKYQFINFNSKVPMYSYVPGTKKKDDRYEKLTDYIMSKLQSQTTQHNQNTVNITQNQLLIPTNILDQIVKNYFKIRENKGAFKKKNKDEVLAYLVYYYLSEDKLFHRRQELSELFETKKKSFTRGEQIVTDYFKLIGKFNNVEQNPILDLCSRYLIELDIYQSEYMILARKIYQIMYDNNIAISFSLGSQASSIICMIISAFDLKLKENPIKILEKKTKNTKTTISKIMHEIILVSDMFQYLNIENFQNKLQNFVDQFLTINKRGL